MEQHQSSPSDIGLRDQFTIPTKAELKGLSTRRTSQPRYDSSPEATYLCGNSLGLQSKVLNELVRTHLGTWATRGVLGHFVGTNGEYSLKAWQDLDEQAAEMMAEIVGAKPHEVAVMEKLTTNLHLAFQSFYRPTKEKYKILIEAKAFPSDHFVVQSQLAQHNYTTREALVLLQPSNPDNHYFSTEHIIKTIDDNAESLALILLPGIQFYSGQLLDIKTITEHAHSKGLKIGWDLAHAAGNVPLHLHDWGVDFAVWCTYKYLNAGPGAAGGLFIHQNWSLKKNPTVGIEGHDHLSGGLEAEQELGYVHRLCGWYGSTKETRFAMKNVFDPIEGARGWQLGNPCAIDLVSVIGSLTVFKKTNMEALRAQSIKLTGYLENRLLNDYPDGPPPYRIMTPSNPNERGAQLSVLLNPGLLKSVAEALESEGVIVDKREPDVIRVAPTPLYNTFTDIDNFISVFFEALKREEEQIAVAAGGV